VQIDESLFGGRRKYNRGDHHRHLKSWVLGIVEESSKRCVLWPVTQRNKDTLTNVIVDHVVAGSTIKTDEWGAYASLNELGFKHLTVNHSISFVAADGTHTQLIESLWANVKAVLKLKRGISANHLTGYLDLYSFFYDAKHQGMSPVDFFIDIIQAGHCY